MEKMEVTLPANLKLSDDPSVTLTIRLIMQGKVSQMFNEFIFISNCTYPVLVVCSTEMALITTYKVKM